MSNWMISHACASIVTPIIAALIICLLFAFSTGDFANMLAGAWVILFYLFILFFISFPVLFLVSFFQDINHKSYFLTTFGILCGLTLIVVSLFFGFPTEGVLRFISAIVLVAFGYSVIQFSFSKVLKNRFQIINEDIAH